MDSKTLENEGPDRRRPYSPPKVEPRGKIEPSLLGSPPPPPTPPMP